MGHLWQRFLLASSLVVGLALGVAATVFGYSNLQTVDIHWAVFHLQGVPLWTVAIVPVALLLIAGTLHRLVNRPQARKHAIDGFLADRHDDQA